MSEVFILWAGEYEDRLPVGVYSTLDAARAASNHPNDWGDAIEGRWWSCEWTKAAIPPSTKPLVFTTRKIPVVDGVAVLPNGRTVETEASWVVVPELPQGGYTEDYLGRPAQSCDEQIERFEVQS